ncbi:Conserved_hypothetical protein [Hexamita inflata]|uniref:Sugar phosphate transporter domain-containing protein n=1 Tax=Hexamita inflata TaxID=28002 RepID=A0AA86RB39_9EUKA|nr:Conserved hypothetical protein [Hexamita inflata]
MYYISLIDVIGTTLTLFGQILCGSGVYIIIYSSLTVSSALGSRIFMKKYFSFISVLGIIVITVGLGVSGITSFNAGSQVIIGIVITLVGTIFHSCVYWLNEYFNHKYGVNLQIMCGYTGLFGFCIFMVYQFSVTIPNWTKLVTDPILEHNGVFWQVGLLYGALILVDLLHMFSQYTVVPRVGSVSTGVGKSISSIIVFVLSHILFCELQTSQCIDMWKMISLGVVVCGVITYSVGIMMKKQTKSDDVVTYQSYTDPNHKPVYIQEAFKQGKDKYLLLTDETIDSQ